MQTDIKTRLAKVTKKIDELLADPLATQERQDKLRKLNKQKIKLEDKLSEKYSDLSVYDKAEMLQEYYIKAGLGALFSPQYAYKEYHIDFTELRINKHYKSYPAVTIGIDLQPTLDMYFTQKGIKKLLKINSLMRLEVEEKWIEFLSEELEEAKKYQADIKGGAK